MIDDTRPRVERNSDGWWIFHCPGCGYGHYFDGRWTFNGNVVRPTFRASLLIEGVRDKVPRCHSFVTDGHIEYLGDCTHVLAGKTVDMEPIE